MSTIDRCICPIHEPFPDDIPEQTTGATMANGDRDCSKHGPLRQVCMTMAASVLRCFGAGFKIIPSLAGITIIIPMEMNQYISNPS